MLGLIATLLLLILAVLLFGRNTVIRGFLWLTAILGGIAILAILFYIVEWLNESKRLSSIVGGVVFIGFFVLWPIYAFATASKDGRAQIYRKAAKAAAYVTGSVVIFILCGFLGLFLAAKFPAPLP